MELIKDRWEKFLEHSFDGLPLGYEGTIIRKVLQNAFYAGFMECYGLFKGEIVGAEEEVGVVMIENIERELKEFVDSLKRSRGRI